MIDPQLEEATVPGVRMALRANRVTRRNHAIDVTCRVANCIESSSGMITEANAVHL